MSVYYALGDALVTQEEMYEKSGAGEFHEFTNVFKLKPDEASIQFSSGSMNAKNLITNYTVASGERVPFVQVGIGKPLTIEIRHVYTGRFPQRTLFSAAGDMLVTSAIKSLATFNAAPRAVNFIRRGIDARSSVRDVSAAEQGTPLVFYTPALVERSSVLTLELAFDEFPNEAFATVSDALTAAAGIPVFLSASSYLVAAGAITKILGELGHRVFDTGPVFSATVPLDFLRPGARPVAADFRLVVEDEVDPGFLRHYHLNSDGILVNNLDVSYMGDIPYVVISVDGRENDAYKEFTATAASAALLDRFLGLSERQEKPLGPLLDALKLYNDWKFRQKADELAAQLAGPDQDVNERKKTLEAYGAAVANIQNDLLKPPALSGQEPTADEAKEVLELMDEVDKNQNDTLKTEQTSG